MRQFASLSLLTPVGRSLSRPRSDACRSDTHLCPSLISLPTRRRMRSRLFPLEQQQSRRQPMHASRVEQRQGRSRAALVRMTGRSACAEEGHRRRIARCGPSLTAACCRQHTKNRGYRTHRNTLSILRSPDARSLAGYLLTHTCGELSRDTAQRSPTTRCQL